MKKYRLLVTCIIAMGIIIIGTSNPVSNFYKTTNLISSGNITNEKADKDKSSNKNTKDKDEDKSNSKSNKDKSSEDKSSDSKNETQKNKKFLICIDPGHQGKGDSNLEPVAPGSSSKKARVSSGTEGIATKKPEYVLNLEASLVLKSILESKGYNVIMTRETHDVNISNSERAILANDKKADMVVRIHADSLNNSSKTGASILIPEKDGKYTAPIYEESNKCAEFIKQNMEQAGIQINGIFQRGDLTGFNWSKVPAVLVEMGFMSNYNEDQMMSNPDYQRKMMQCIADGLDAYFK
ncbi:MULTISPECIES: N-acetylmuramoyl-L-alanine amidase [unclassified Clostridioides]|uniref:N-acetylmuramoyl-L-alanine amidase n=1 Tax=unclassified Clostridioides TaxID=2635829 RepID=UPI001D122CD5|nr:N-acetylmuramoyl-L-alanine amidase [Clostridioides sp. ES-S-0056-01]MCC0713699.1 N-acetylmuramoyl-L-alanine amidase [Clostridioides sp. ES-S-0077-01]